MNVFFIFYEVILPILLIAGIGVVFGKRFAVDPDNLGRVAYYFFSPAFIFFVISTNQSLEDNLFTALLCVLVVHLILMALAYGFAKMTHHDVKWQSVTVMTITTPNIGNLALSVILFHYGKDILPLAGLVYVLIFSHSLMGAVFVANREAGLSNALKAVAKTPSIVAFVLGLVVALTGLQLPVPIYRMTDLMGDAMIPLMLFTIGAKLSYMPSLRISAQVVSIGIARLIVSPLLVVGILVAMQQVLSVHIDPLLFELIVLNYAMPTALICSILAMRYDLLPNSVTMIALVSTIASLATLSVLLTWL